MTTLVQKRISAIFGSNTDICNSLPCHGGCINTCARLELSDGTRLFLKTNTHQMPGMFEAEAKGLQLLKSPHGPRIPDVVDVFSDATHQYLLLEYLSSDSRMPDYDSRLGRQLATLHKHHTGDRYGLPYDNYIGASPQRNTPCDKWIPFFINARLMPQMAMAAQSGYLSRGTLTKLDALIGKLDRYLVEPHGLPSLLHGDLWGGNHMAGPNGEPVLIDPAVYYGVPETDLAMTELFGGFSPAFYAAYNDVLPEEPGYRDRVPLYNLYHLINHANIFGNTYESSVLGVVNRYV